MKSLKNGNEIFHFAGLTEARRSLETNRGNSAGGRHIQALRRRIAANRNMKQLKWSYAPTERPSMSLGRETNLGRRIAECKYIYKGVEIIRSNDYGFLVCNC